MYIFVEYSYVPISAHQNIYYSPTPNRLYHRGIPVNVGLHGTPGDYAWGPQGLDNIITQLLATFEDSGPPPADTKKVEELPFVQATEEDLKPCELLFSFPVSCPDLPTIHC